MSRKDVIVDTPLVGVDRGGTTTVSWLESRRGRRSPYVMAAVARKGTGFGTPVQLGRSSPEGDLGFGQSMVVARDGGAVLAWDDGRRVVAARRPAGSCSSRSARACFGSTRHLSGPRVAGARPATAIGLDGRAHVVWMDGTGAIRLATARPGLPLKTSQRVSPAGQPASNPVVAAARAGRA